MYRWERVPPVRSLSSSAHYKLDSPASHYKLYGQNVDDDEALSDSSASIGYFGEGKGNGNEMARLNDLEDTKANEAYKTVTQNDFLLECVIDGKDSISIVHAFDESENSVAVDAVLLEMSKKYLKCNFCRLDGSKSPLVSKKLVVSRFPTVLILKDREVINRITHFGDSDYFTTEGESRMLRAWVGKMLAEYC
jgi:hypothetical protein